MEDQEQNNCELYSLLEKLNSEADKTVKAIEQMRKKGTDAIRRAESVNTSSVRETVQKKTSDGVLKIIERFIDINCDIELAEDDFSIELTISYLPVGSDAYELKFFAGDDPWNFWLTNNNIDVKTLHKHLLKKHQNDLLESYPYPKPGDSVCFLDRNKVFRGLVLQISSETRVKALDVDSNISRVVPTDKVFRIDPDACHELASALKCTITKDAPDTKLWNSYLRDVFCNALKEATLQIKVLERLPETFPVFLVEVTLHNDEGESASLKEWINERLLPELKKLPAGESDSVCDFLSAEALNPYSNTLCEESSRIIKSRVFVSEPTVKVDLPQAPSPKETNNLNSACRKPAVSGKVVPNVEEKPPTPECNNAQTKTPGIEEEAVLSSSEVDSEIAAITDMKLNNIVTKPNHSSGGFKPINPNSVVFGYAHPAHYPQQPPIMYASNFNAPQPQRIYPVPPPLHGHCVPPPPHWRFGGYPLQHVQVPQVKPPQVPVNWQRHVTTNYPQWSPIISQTMPPSSQAVVEKNPQQWSSGKTNAVGNDSSSDKKMNFSNLNNISLSVNVLANEFVPSHTQETRQEDNNNKQLATNSLQPTTPIKVPDEIIHHQLRKPNSLLKPNENLLVLISHVESPDEFYVHFLTKNNSLLDKLGDMMFMHYNTTEKVVYKNWDMAKKALDRFCVCKWLEDNRWYRVEITDWTIEHDKVKVFFVDYGNTDWVEMSCLQPLTESFTKLAMCAQPCHLAKVFPPFKLETWPLESLEFFRTLLENSCSTSLTNSCSSSLTKVYSVTVVPSISKTSVANSLSVLLYEGKCTENSKSINDLLMDFQMAYSKPVKTRSSESTSSDVYFSQDDISDTISENGRNFILEPPSSLQLPSEVPKLKADPSEDEELETWDPQAEEFYSVRNNPMLDTDDPGVALVGYKAQDEARICKFFAKSGQCYKAVCNKEHILPNPDDVTTDKEEVYTKSFSEIALPTLGEEVEVKVTFVECISLFYVQMQERRAVGVGDDSDEQETLTTLHNFMNEPDNVRMMRYLKTDPALGQLVLARSEGQWYRARVCSMGLGKDNAEDDVEVLFVDYGSCCIVNLKDLRDMEPRYLHLPFQAVECSLANIQVPVDITSEQYKNISEMLKQLIEGVVLTAKVYTSKIDESSLVMDVLLNHSSFGDIGEFLIGQELVDRAQLNWQQHGSRHQRTEYLPAG